MTEKILTISISMLFTYRIKTEMNSFYRNKTLLYINKKLSKINKDKIKDSHFNHLIKELGFLAIRWALTPWSFKVL